MAKRSTEARASCALDGETRLAPRVGVWVAIDPGTTESAIAVFEDERLCFAETEPNEHIAHALRMNGSTNGAGDDTPYAHLAIEMVACMGMAVGAETFETVLWIGRFIEAYGGPHTKIYRQEEKLHLCGNVRAKDANIRQALIDLYGGDSVAIGGVKCPMCKGKGYGGRQRLICAQCGGNGYRHPPGPLKGISGDQWAALAVGRTWWDTKRPKLYPLAEVEAGT